MDAINVLEAWCSFDDACYGERGHGSVLKPFFMIFVIFIFKKVDFECQSSSNQKKIQF